MSQYGPEGSDPRPEEPGSSLGSSSLGGSSLGGSSLDDARESAAREQPPSSPFSRESAVTPQQWPSYPPAAAPEPAPPTQDLGYPPAPDQGYPATPPYGYPPTPDGYPATPGYGSSPYEVNPYQPTFGGYSPYGYGAAPLPHPQSTTALVLGIVGVTFCPFAGIGGLVLGNRARREIDAQPQRYSGRGPATAGWVLGIISIVVLVFWVLFVALGIAGAWDS